VEEDRPCHVPSQTMGFNHHSDPYIQRNQQRLPVSLAQHRNKIISITSEMISNLLKGRVVAIGEMKLGIQCLEVRTHSIQSGAAIAMYLVGVPIFSIMLIGRWSPEVHQKTSSRVFSWHLLENDQGTIIQTHQQPHNNQHDGFNCWRLVFIADGIN
jgi:hypothetical protein